MRLKNISLIALLSLALSSCCCLAPKDKAASSEEGALEPVEAVEVVSEEAAH